MPSYAVVGDLHLQAWVSFCLSSLNPSGLKYLCYELFKKITEAAAYIYKLS